MWVTDESLFAINYLKEHAPTISEFKTIWDNVPSETKKVRQWLCDFRAQAHLFYQKYEASSKEQKVAARLAATTMRSEATNWR